MPHFENNARTQQKEVKQTKDKRLRDKRVVLLKLIEISEAISGELVGNGEIEICGSASVGLEENSTKEISILTIQSNCD